MRHLTFGAMVVGIALGVIGPVAAAPVTAPYSIDFTQFPPGTANIPNLNTYATNPTTSSDGAFILQANSAPFASLVPPSASLQVTNLNGRDFELSTHFTYTSQAGGAIYLDAFSSSSDLYHNSHYGLSFILGGMIQLSGIGAPIV